MPIGRPIFFEGDIYKFESAGAFGFFYCKITSPEYLEHPILQRRIKTAQGLRTIAGLGTWEGWILSSEMENAIKYGYTFEIIKGYLFEKGDLFSGYVDRMYNLRKQYAKSHAMNLIAKLLMNSLYGKFGMKLESTTVDIYNVSTDEAMHEFEEMLGAFGESIQDYIQIDDSYIIVRDSLINLKYDKNEDVYHGLDVNIAIASAITSHARVHMSIFKNNSDFNLFYTDTDSAVIDKALPEYKVGGELGQVKLEHTIDRAVFLAPKTYALISDEGTEVIKVKGITPAVAENIHINDLEHLLIQDSSKEFTQEKWFKKVIEGEINVSDVAYTLKVTSNKRALIYVDGIFEGTRPYNYDEILK
jgi:hypothetical protein